MTALLTPRGSAFSIGSGFGWKPTMFRKDNGALSVEGAAVFRSGTFRDSMGEQGTWEPLHIKQAVDNYNHLSSSGIFADVPVRDGHSGWIISNMPGNGRVVGYHTKLWNEQLTAPHDNQNYEYLLTNFDITDPRAAEQILNGTWRNRSAEMGTYRTNSEAEYWPVYMGVAYVDIPAVEGLKFSGNQPAATGRLFVFMDTKETGVATDTPGTPQGQAAPAALLGVPQPATSFSINGAATTDVVAVQTHITALERFRAETQESNRTDFVTSQVQAGKLLATQVDSMGAFAKSLTPEQFEAWKATFTAAPVTPLTANHGGGVSNPDNSAQSGVSAEDQAVANDLETVRMHRMAGTSSDKIKETASYKRLVVANKAPVL